MSRRGSEGPDGNWDTGEAAHRAEAGRYEDEAMRARNPIEMIRLHLKARRHAALARKCRQGRQTGGNIT